MKPRDRRSQYNFNLSIQRQLSSSTVLEVSYNGVMGAHLQTGLLKTNQIPLSMIDKYGASVLTSSITSAAGVASGVRLPSAPSPPCGAAAPRWPRR